MKQAFIFSVSDNDAESSYCYLSLLLLESLVATNPGDDVYCAILTDRPPCVKLIKELENRCNVIVDPRFRVNGHRNYFLRPATCGYFSHLLSRYDQLVYSDIDAVYTNKFTFELPPYSFLHEEWTDQILLEVEGRIPEFHTFPWLNIVTDTNKFLYDSFMKDSFDPNEFRFEQFCTDVKSSGLNLVHNDFTTIYPYRPYQPHHQAFHYDGFIYCGYAFMLKRLSFYDRLEPIINKYFNFKQIVPFYWERRARRSTDPA